MTATIFAFPSPHAPVNATPPSEFHCAQQVVAHCLEHIGIVMPPGELGRRAVDDFVEELTRAGYAIVRFWVLENKGDSV